MNCALCKKSIDNYNAALHRMFIDEARSADVCSDCIAKFTAWQSQQLASLFPTKAMKKMYKK